jgi:hypothetical protein
MSDALLHYPAFRYAAWRSSVARDPAKANLVLTAFFFLLLLFAGWRDHSFILPGRAVGLLQHPGPWVYLAGQALLPFAVRTSVRRLENLKETVPDALSDEYLEANLPEHRRRVATWIDRERPLSTFTYALLTIVGMAILAWNSISNQQPIKRVGFEFWDSVSFFWGYAITRFEKLYFWVLLMPCLVHLQVMVVLEMSRLLTHAARNHGLVLRPYHEDGAGGTRALIDTVLHQLVPTFFFASMLSLSAMFAHRKFDPTTIGGLSLTCALFIVVYLVPAIALRNAIVVEKQRQMAEVARRQETLYTAILAEKPVDDAAGMLGKLSAVADQLRKLPEWPQFARVVQFASVAASSPTVVWAYHRSVDLIAKWVNQ